MYVITTGLNAMSHVQYIGINNAELKVATSAAG